MLRICSWIAETCRLERRVAEGFFNRRLNEDYIYSTTGMRRQNWAICMYPFLF